MWRSGGPGLRFHLGDCGAKDHAHGVRLGFVIGISALRLHWAGHGAVMGLLLGSLFSYSVWMMGDPAWLVPALLAGSMIFGVGIEFFTTVVFKQPQQIPGAVDEQVEIPRRAAA